MKEYGNDEERQLLLSEQSFCLSKRNSIQKFFSILSISGIIDELFAAMGVAVMAEGSPIMIWPNANHEERPFVRKSHK